MKSPIQQSLVLPPFHEQGASNGDLIDAAADIGYAAIEVWGREDDFEEVVTRAQEKGLGVALVDHLQDRFQGFYPGNTGPPHFFQDNFS